LGIWLLVSVNLVVAHKNHNSLHFFVGLII
jgi:hypothetical protein